MQTMVGHVWAGLLKTSIVPASDADSDLLMMLECSRASTSDCAC